MLKFPLGLILISSLLIASCKKEGCKDQSSATFDKDVNLDNSNCKYYYFDRLTVDITDYSAIEVDTEDSEDLALPDLQVELRVYNNDQLYLSPVFKDNQDYPLDLEIPIKKEEIAIPGAIYEFIVSDVDYLGKQQILLQEIFIYNGEEIITLEEGIIKIVLQTTII